MRYCFVGLFAGDLPMKRILYAKAIQKDCERNRCTMSVISVKKEEFMTSFFGSVL